MRTLTAASVLALSALSAPAHAEVIGGCRFDRDSLSFAGSRVEQASCLLRKVELLGVKADQPLPPVIRTLMENGGSPSASQKAAALALFPEPYRTFAILHQDDPASRTAAGLPAEYFVIHDTSEPFFGTEPFPRHLDTDWKVNSFTAYMDQTFAAEPVAHIFLSRYGQIWAGHDFAVPWRATKLESRIIGAPARGRFLHIETMQPRRFLDGYRDRGHTYGPTPGFSGAQYRMLAALYVYASARARHWLIPAFHATVDDQIPDAHDDPQNFKLDQFARELERLVAV